MNQEDRKKVIKEALASLGDNVPAIAKQLIKLGIKGHRCSSGACPIAQFLKTKISLGSGEYISIGVNDCGIVGSNGDITVFFIPQPITDFVNVFDSGISKLDFNHSGK